MEEKYYFVTYNAPANSEPFYVYYHELIKGSPLTFFIDINKKLNNDEWTRGTRVSIINTVEISKEEYEQNKDNFYSILNHRKNKTYY